MFHTVGLCTLSKAFLKSMKLTSILVFPATHLSMIWRSAKIWSQHDRFFLKPPCCCLSMLSAASWTLFRIIDAITFPGTESNVIPLQLLQSLVSLFLGIGIIIPSRQSCGTSPVFHIMLHSLVILVIISFLPLFINSACTYLSKYVRTFQKIKYVPYVPSTYVEV